MIRGRFNPNQKGSFDPENPPEYREEQIEIDGEYQLVRVYLCPNSLEARQVVLENTTEGNDNEGDKDDKIESEDDSRED